MPCCSGSGSSAGYGYGFVALPPSFPFMSATCLVSSSVKSIVSISLELMVCSVFSFYDCCRWIHAVGAIVVLLIGHINAGGLNLVSLFGVHFSMASSCSVGSVGAKNSFPDLSRFRCCGFFIFANIYC